MTNYLLAVHGRLPGGFEYSWHLALDSAHTAADLITSSASALTDFWTNGTYGVGTQYHTDTTLDTFDIYTMSGTWRATNKTSFALTLAGTSTDNPLADSSTLTIKKASTGVQRNERGFISLPAPVEGTLSAGFYSSATRTRFQEAAEALFVNMTADGTKVVVHTGAAETKGGVAPYTSTVIVAMHASNKPGTRRQRTRKQIGVYV
jgi:hypothetical protein